MEQPKKPWEIKPDKKLYDNQEEVIALALKYISEQILKHDCISEAYVVGSFATKQVGVYDGVYSDNGFKHTASDLDLLILIDESKKIPSNWKFMNITRELGDIYFLGVLNYQNNQHIIESVLIMPSKHGTSKMKKSLTDRKYIRVK
ncbi:hypothetical protein KY338_06790 [Candidatus Woesearchaeota archaeon]|nr:hypothetical protein [Candidatus Woesearchaeota archaeon]MBW3006389.1 hypothetical protein [Candidatus Woesearchaeota archaeon]